MSCDLTVTANRPMQEFSPNLQALAIRRRLRHSWIPFFAAFGKLTPIQSQAIPHVLDRHNLVVCSPTASGKTEAVVAPAAELLVREDWQGLSILYLVPTRALANDTLARIQDPLREMGVSVSLKHGDKPHLGRVVPDVLITTIESLDSLLCRSAEMLAGIAVVIIDEVHFLHGTYRGDQLLILLGRLRETISPKQLQICVLSATMGSPERLGEIYCGNAEIVQVSGHRPIELQPVGSVRELVQYAESMGFRKVLCFCNSRKRTEEVAIELSEYWKRNPVLVHHGSLGRQDRESAEQVMKQRASAMCVATATLEIGIDIGNIDLIGLCDIPWTLSSFLQRVGRGSRRSMLTNVAAVVTNDEETRQISAMCEAARTGIVPQAGDDHDQSVACQQVLSYLFERRDGVTIQEMRALLRPLCNERETSVILDNMESTRWIEQRRGVYFGSEKLLNLGEHGKIHSNIPDEGDYKVIDINSGKVVGRVVGFPDNMFVLGGKTWNVVSFGSDVIRVRRTRVPAGIGRFVPRRRAGAFNWLLPVPMRKLQSAEFGGERGGGQ